MDPLRRKFLLFLERRKYGRAKEATKQGVVVVDCQYSLKFSTGQTAEKAFCTGTLATIGLPSSLEAVTFNKLSAA